MHKNGSSLLRHVAFYEKTNEAISRLKYPSINLQICSLSIGESPCLVLPSSTDCFRIAAFIARRVNSISSVVTLRLHSRSSTTSSIILRSIGRKSLVTVSPRSWKTCARRIIRSPVERVDDR